MDDHVPVPLDQIVVLVQVGVGCDDHAFTGIAGVLELVHFKADDLGVALPVGDHVVVRRDDQDVTLAGQLHALDGAESDDRLAYAGVVSHERATATVGEPVLYELHVLLLLWEQPGEVLLDALQVAGYRLVLVVRLELA